jgi:hypothetical protein
MQVSLICHLVSGEQVEILSDKEQGLEEAYHAAHSAFDERKIVSGRPPDGGYVLIDAGSVCTDVDVAPERARPARSLPASRSCRA